MNIAKENTQRERDPTKFLCLGPAARLGGPHLLRDCHRLVRLSDEEVDPQLR